MCTERAFIERNPGDKIIRSRYTSTKCWAMSSLCCLPHVQICPISFHKLFYYLYNFYLTFLIIFTGTVVMLAVFSHNPGQQLLSRPESSSLPSLYINKRQQSSDQSHNAHRIVFSKLVVTSVVGKSRQIHNFCHTSTTASYENGASHWKVHGLFVSAHINVRDDSQQPPHQIIVQYL